VAAAIFGDTTHAKFVPTQGPQRMPALQVRPGGPRCPASDPDATPRSGDGAAVHRGEFL
jgi:hypothetical protein